MQEMTPPEQDTMMVVDTITSQSDSTPSSENLGFPPKRLRWRITRQQGIAWALLAIIVLLGGYLRFVGQNWDDFSGMHPDERFLTTNLLPLIGGGLEFTRDEVNFPQQTLYVRHDDVLVRSRTDIQLNQALMVATLKNSFSHEFLKWWVGESRIVALDTVEAIYGALVSGSAQVIVLSSDVGFNPLNLSGGAVAVRALETIPSESLQQIRCQYYYPNTNGLGGYFDARCSSLNPHNAGNGFYAYGTLPLFIAYVAGDFIRTQDLLGSTLFSFEGFPMVWRFFSAFFDVGSIILLFFTGARLHNRWVGLLASLLYAVAPLAIQKAHYGTVNAITAFFVVLAIWASVNVQLSGKRFYYLIFGVAFGASLAGRINLLPLVGVLGLAFLVQIAPTFSPSMSYSDRQALFMRHFISLVWAGFATVLTFRLVNPYAFVGDGFFGLLPNNRFLSDLASSREGVSGRMDSPPNFQWLGRASYLYPLKDMVLWGMGLAQGVVAVVATMWASYQLVMRRSGSQKHLLLVAWVVVYFGFMGNQWVMTMRYYLPLYGAMTLLGAWMLYEVVRVAVPLTRWLLVGFGGVLLLVPVYYLVNGNPLTLTATAAGVVAVLLWGSTLIPSYKGRGVALVAFVGLFSVIWALMFTNIYRQQLTRVQGSRWVWENVHGDFSMRIENAPEGTPLINIPLNNENSRDSGNVPASLIASATKHTPSRAYLFDFVAPADGIIRSVYAPHLGDAFGTEEAESLYLSISAKDDRDNLTLLAETVYTANFTRDTHPMGDPHTIVLPEAVAIQAGQRYTFKAESVDGSFMSAGEIVLTEGDWDDRITTVMICTFPFEVTLADNPPSGLLSYDNCNGLNSWHALVHSFDMAMSYPVDDTLKRENIRSALPLGDYLAITSNRFYDTEPRHASRFPLTTRYYEALFNGELGYELVEVFSEHYEWMGLSVDDQHLPIYESPMWFNEFEADEAFHVYDHPAVFIFKKRADYDQRRVDLVLDSISLKTVFEVNVTPDTEIGEDILGVINWTSLQGDEVPNTLMLAPDTRTMNQLGGTWSERFNINSVLYTNQPLGVVVWWIVIALYGWVAFPILFAVFPKLADRGYGFARLIGLFLVGYLAWFFAGLKVPLWSQGGIFISFVAVALFSVWISWSRWGEIRDYVRQNMRQLLTIEVLALGLYVAFIGVRLTNPDLWHDFKGGEKPMDFAYFNAVLRATTFPPPDPWYSGGYINYYYWGYVLVGSPVLMLQLVPSFAYNLIIPTLFAITGVGAFSVAFNIVARWRETHPYFATARRLGNPYSAGVMALLLCVVLGNLDTIRVLGNGIAQLGGYQQPQGIEAWLLSQAPQPPTVEDASAVQARVRAGYITDRVAYEINNVASLVAGFVNGVGKALSGNPLPIGTDRWYWGPSRVLAETPGVAGNAITEMPYFTFVYGDLHAHMINLPVLLFVVLFLYAELIQVHDERRTTRERIVALLIGALSVGMIRAINTWDWPAFLLFSVVALGYAWWLRYQAFTWDSVVYMVSHVGGFVVMSFAFALPYTTWYAATYGSIALWQEGKTPLWAYFDIHGVFLFLSLSLLIWETVRWLKATRVSALRGWGNWLLTFSVVTVFLWVLSLALAIASYQVALIVLPMLVWIAILFFRPNQSLEMQFVLVTLGLALAMTLGVEIIVLGGDIGRQNTVFKFYMQAWVLFAIVGGVAWAWVSRSSETWSLSLTWAWFMPFFVLVFIALMFPIMATRGRSFDRMSPNIPLTLDGLDYMSVSSHALHYSNPISFVSLSDDYAIIRWLQDNVQGTPYIMEGRNDASEYTLTARVAINTGLPTVLGWRFHQTQQRTFDPLPRLVDQRELNVKYFYRTQDIEGAVRILRHYDVSYVIVGGVERAFGTTEGLAKFEGMAEQGLLTLVHEQGDGRIYQVNSASLEAYLLNQGVVNNHENGDS